MTKARLEEINSKSGCLIPIPGAKSVITSHEKTFCDCTIKDLLAHIDDQERRLGIAENALKECCACGPQEPGIEPFHCDAHMALKELNSDRSVG